MTRSSGGNAPGDQELQVVGHVGWVAGSPAGSADGSVWAESVTNCTSIGNTETAYVRGVVRFKP